jgi:hypothetical protein
MSIFRFLLSAITTAILAACVGTFFHQQRQFLIEGEQPLSPAEQRAVFDAFKGYMRQQGRVAFLDREVNGTSTVFFRIHRIGYGPESELLFADGMHLKYTDGEAFVVTVRRDTALPDVFTEDGIANFITETEGSLHSATGKKIRLRLIAGGN